MEYPKIKSSNQQAEEQAEVIYYFIQTTNDK